VLPILIISLLATCLLPLLLLPLQTCSQVLLTLDNLADRSQYMNTRNTFTELLAYGTIPVINENVSAGCSVAVALPGPDWQTLLTDQNAVSQSALLAASSIVKWSSP
jgi:hypothetical protein